MTIARAKLVDVSLSRWYHPISRCVRTAFLLGEGDDDRREWLENRLEELANIFAVAVGGFSMTENHLHVLLRLDPEVARAWSDSVYIDLNPVVAQVARTPEAIAYTSIKQRVDHVHAEGKIVELAAAEKGSVAGSQAAAGLEESLWLCPIEDHRRLDSNRDGTMQDFPPPVFSCPTTPKITPRRALALEETSCRRTTGSSAYRITAVGRCW
jgi:hypothetical protein